MALFIATAIVESGTQIGNLSAGMMEDPRPPRTTLEPADRSRTRIPLLNSASFVPLKINQATILDGMSRIA
ncbi:unnamed protein product [Tenebrio molitor]|nr:unnamed protein product [Tenebrio molitor]